MKREIGPPFFLLYFNGPQAFGVAHFSYAVTLSISSFYRGKLRSLGFGIKAKHGIFKRAASVVQSLAYETFCLL